MSALIHELETNETYSADLAARAVSEIRAGLIPADAEIKAYVSGIFLVWPMKNGRGESRLALSHGNPAVHRRITPTGRIVQANPDTEN